MGPGRGVAVWDERGLLARTLGHSSVVAPEVMKLHQLQCGVLWGVVAYKNTYFFGRDTTTLSLVASR